MKKEETPKTGVTAKKRVGTTERRTQQQRREETRSKLINAAIDLIQTKGAANFTTMQVAEAAGMTRGAIQYHFSSPKDLLREVIVAVVHFLSDLVEVEDLRTLEKWERIDQLIDDYWKGYRTDIYIVFVEIAVQGRRDPELRQTIEEALGVLEQERDEQWLGLFFDFEQSDTEKLGWRSTLLQLLRGLAVKQMFARPDEDMEEQFRISKEMFKLHVKAQVKG